MWKSYYDYQLSKVRWTFGNQVLMFKLYCCHEHTDSVSSRNLSAFELISSKVCEIIGNDIVTIENKESCPWQHCNFVTEALLHLTQLIIVVNIFT